jgi:hypothetical protein
MSKSSQHRVQKSNIKIYIIFAVVLLCSFGGGYFAGRVGAGIQDRLDAINWADVAQTLYIPAIVVFGLLVAGSFAICLAMYFRVKKHLAQIGQLDDDAYEEALPEVEKTIGVLTAIAGAVEVVSLFCYPFILLCAETMSNAEVAVSGSSLVVANLLFVAELACYMVILALAVGQEKKLNPEKRGNIFDFRFRRQWFGSMDEAELIHAAKAAQTAYTAGLYTGLFLWLIAFISMFLFHTGILPVVVVTIMMLVMYIVGAVKSI